MRRTSSSFVNNGGEAVDRYQFHQFQAGYTRLRAWPPTTTEGGHMKNQALKTMTMIGVLLILSAVSVHAQAGSSFRMTVPFDFIVSDKTLPAGEYIVMRSTRGSAEGLRIQSQDSRHGAYVNTLPVGAADIQEQTKAVFRRYDNQYFLSQVWISG